jgi:hypothetical protein
MADYVIPRALVPTRATPDAVHVAYAPDLAGADTMHNILFIPDGFLDTDADLKRFDEIVAKVVDEMFTKPRHQPYPLLEGRFNVWKAYAASPQHVLTCGYHINELPSQDNRLPKGYPIPYNGSPTGDATKYTVEELVRRVGLPQQPRRATPSWDSASARGRPIAVRARASRWSRSPRATTATPRSAHSSSGSTSSIQSAPCHWILGAIRQSCSRRGTPVPATR